MKKFNRYLVPIGILLISAGMLYGLVRSIMCNGIESSEAAGWAQAIGAIAAIGGAFFIAHQERRRTAIEEHQNSLVTLNLLTQEAIQFVFNFKSQLNKPTERTIIFDRVAFEGIRSSLAQIRFSTLDPKTLGYLFKLKDVLGEIYEMCSEDVSPDQRFERSEFGIALSNKRTQLTKIQKEFKNVMHVHRIPSVDLTSISNI